MIGDERVIAGVPHRWREQGSCVPCVNGAVVGATLPLSSMSMGQTEMAKFRVQLSPSPKDIECLYSLMISHLSYVLGNTQTIPLNLIFILGGSVL